MAILELEEQESQEQTEAMDIPPAESTTKINEAFGGGEGPSSTPEFRQAMEEGLLELDQEQLQGEGAGRSGVPPGVSGMSALAAAPASRLTAPSPLPSFPISEDQESMAKIKKGSECQEQTKDLEIFPTEPMINIEEAVGGGDQVTASILKTPSRKHKLSVTTPSSSKDDSAAKRQKMLLPSPGKRWLAKKSLDMEPQVETTEELAEMVVLGETCYESVKVSQIQNLSKFRTTLYHL